MSAVYHAADRCVFCGESTAFGAGRFVNRVSATTTADQAPWLPADLAAAGGELEVDGFACAECVGPLPGEECTCTTCTTCSDCDGIRTNHPDSDVPDLCSWCAEGHDDEDDSEAEEDPA
jgi:hypothetical protein